MNDPWWKSNGGMLDPDKHARFVVRREEMARDARVPPQATGNGFLKRFSRRGVLGSAMAETTLNGRFWASGDRSF